MIFRVLVCSWWWFSVALVYYGLAINSVSLPGTHELNFALASIASVPGDLAAVVLLDRLGRKKTLFAGFLICGMGCIATACVSKGNLNLTSVYLQNMETAKANPPIWYPVPQIRIIISTYFETASTSTASTYWNHLPPPQWLLLHF